MGKIRSFYATREGNVPFMRELLNRTLETERLFLEPIRLAHAVEAWEGLRDPRLWTHFPTLIPASLDDLRARYARWASPDAGHASGEIWGNWVCRNKRTGKLVGSLQTTVLPPESAYVAYMIYMDHQRNGYAREALTALIDLLRDSLHLRRLYAEIAPANAASIGLIASLGFTLVPQPEATWLKEF